VQGRIIKGIGGLYFVDTYEGILECKPKGIFRKSGIKPLVGDNVTAERLADGSGLISEVLDRKSVLIRPEVANATLAVLVFAVNAPKPNLNLADRFLINMEMAGVPAILVFNKSDLASEEEIENIKNGFSGSGYEIRFISAKMRSGTDDLKERLKGEITVLAGPSGVGKSTIVNFLTGADRMETGSLSEKIMRGKNTTRHSELLGIDEDSYIFDTPGFTSFDLFGIEAGELGLFYPEIKECLGKCRFTGCSHINEPDCAVKEKLRSGGMSKNRYDNYVMLYNEIKSRRKY
jgi:ribosome biogenesis GTPase